MNFLPTSSYDQRNSTRSAWWRAWVALCVLASAAGAAPDVIKDERVAPVQLSGEVTYHVTMTTSLVIPDTGKKIEGINIWQALPTRKPWSATKAGPASGTGAQEVFFTPADGTQVQRDQHNSDQVVWRENGEFAPGKSLNFSTTYTVHSAARRFDPAELNLQWALNFTPPTDIEPNLAKTADEIRRKMGPAEAVKEFCTRIQKNITYDATVSYPADDVASTVAFRRGHCGHIYNVFAQLCRRVGIPVRHIVGLNLSSPDGYGRLANVRADWSNIHTWAEVYFPEVGWVEVEPSWGAKAFSIPARYVENNKWFQNYVIQIIIDGKVNNAGWVPDNGAFVSPYQVKNLITFSVG